MRVKIACIVVALAMVTSMVGFAVPALAADECAACAECTSWVTYPLFAGQTWQVGNILVSNSADKICVKYVLFDTGVADLGWRMTETHVAISATDPRPKPYSGIPQTKTGNPIPGQFEYSRTYESGAKSDCFSIPRPAGWTRGTKLYIAAHAAVNKPSTSHLVSGSFCVTSGVNTKLADAVTPATLCWVHPLWNSNLRDATSDATSDLWQDANWVWDTYLNPSPRNGDLVDLYHEFQIPDGATIKTAALSIAADNAFSWRLNGGAWTDVNLAGDWRSQPVFSYPTYVVDPNPTAWKKVYTYDVAGQISPLANALYVTGVNAAYDTDDPQANPAGVLYKLCGTWEQEVSDNNSANDSAWGGTLPFNGKNWAKFMEYTVQDWTLVETVVVPSNGTLVSSAMTLASGKPYKLQASGIYTFAPGWLPAAGIADAEYSLRAPGSYNPSPTPQWVSGDVFPGSLNGYLEVKIDSANVTWGAFDSSHVYTVTYTGTGSQLTAKIWDDYYGDNSGSITVKIYAFQ
jgi:hypothetical protein